MTSMNVMLAENIKTFRKKAGLTQEELADRLGITYQAVSKWENAKAAPDILLLPVMAEIFGCYIDELFSRKVKTEIHYDLCSDLPWYDDNVLRGVVFEGRKLLQATDGITDKFTFELIGNAKSVQSECNVTVAGSVTGGCNAGKEITVGGNLSGGCNAGKEITVGGNLSGGCNAGRDITVGRDLSGDVTCRGDVVVRGNVEAKKIEGNVTCNALKCEKIEGNVTIKET